MDQPPQLPPHFKQPLLPTPFHERARALSQVDSFVPWAGYSTVDVFSTMEQEYFAIRNASTLYDLTPMVKYRIAGADAGRFLNRLLTRDVSRLKVNRVSYCVWCNDDGAIIDDGTLFRLGELEYRLCTAEWQLDWLLGSAIGFDVHIDEVTADIAALAMQGPTSCAVLSAMGLAGIERLKPFEIGFYASAGIDLMISRTGFTGDLGYELWVDPAASRRALGCLNARGAQSRNPPDRVARAQCGAYRGRLSESQDRLRVRGKQRARWHRPFTAGIGARVAGGFRQGALHGPAGIA